MEHCRQAMFATINFLNQSRMESCCWPTKMFHGSDLSVAFVVSQTLIDYDKQTLYVSSLEGSTDRPFDY